MPRNPLEKVEEAREQLERCQNTAGAARLRLNKTIREADRSRIPRAEIARAAGLSRPTVYAILDDA